jgi:hypothetical protein
MYSNTVVLYHVIMIDGDEIHTYIRTYNSKASILAQSLGFDHCVFEPVLKGEVPAVN